MDMALNVTKGLFQVLFWMLRLACRVVAAGSDVSDERHQTSVYDAYEAHELYEKGDISLDEFLKATRPK